MSRAKILAPFCWIWSVFAKRLRRSLQLSKNKDIFNALLWGEVDTLFHMINDSAEGLWPIGLYVGFTTSFVSGDVRHPFSFEIYIALGSTHGPEFFPTGFYFWFT